MRKNFERVLQLVADQRNELVATLASPTQPRWRQDSKEMFYVSAQRQ